jgi:anti-sigma factor RsiW
MTPEPRKLSDDALIHAWLDGALDPQSQDASRARAALEADPQLAARIEREREADSLLASALNAYAHTRERLPSIDRAVARAGMIDRMTQTGLTAALALALFTGGWFTHALTGTPASAPDASPTRLAYLEGETALMPASFDNDGLHEPVMEPPRLSGHGLNLTAVETRSVDGGVLNRMEYQRRDGTGIRILVRSENRFRDEAVTTTNVDGQTLVYWREGNMTVGITGAASESELERIALEVREQVRPAVSGPSLAENVLTEPDSLPEQGIPVQTVSDTSIPPG